MRLVYLFSPFVVVSYGSAPLLRKHGSDTERIIVPFSPKGVNYMVYLAHVATCVLVCATVCLIVMLSLSDTTDVSAVRAICCFNTNNLRVSLFHVAQYGDDITDNTRTRKEHNKLVAKLAFVNNVIWCEECCQLPKNVVCFCQQTSSVKLTSLNHQVSTVRAAW